ncbi:uncharacterized protein BJ171DRAFT_424635 [Polychytrium aggregatum]|uniref:uncharacterized protein n=1 Tax=Polychytrium aggregatum TaxID=110093 RepID=UPI0022FEEDE5|nr:uncharacterized protein BJ171DRAFT_424635 [Polychytrium aggregatum]KAI9204042.1 hypothetical protein BJ171DRAFT_424635 [Polychytrium aggregatum]
MWCLSLLNECSAAGGFRLHLHFDRYSPLPLLLPLLLPRLPRSRSDRLLQLCCFSHRICSQAINYEHPFGIKIWKPALYKKHRSIDHVSYSALHSLPGASYELELFLSPFNWLWTILFGWWIALVYLALALAVFFPVGLLGKLVLLLSFGSSWKSVLANLSGYILWPFGKYIAKKRLKPVRAPTGESTGLLSDFDQLDSTPEIFVVPSSAPLSNRSSQQQQQQQQQHLAASSPEAESHEDAANHRRTSVSRRPTGLWANLKRWLTFLFDSGLTGIVFHFITLLVLAPIHLVVSLTGFLLVFPIPMARLNYSLLKHLLRHPLSSITLGGRHAGDDDTLILCTRHAVGLKYYKYTFDGVNIIIVDLLGFVLFSLLQYYFTGPRFGYTGFASHTTILFSALISTVPLAYYVGMGVSSITAQTGLALGAVINATFGSVIEIILYVMALIQGKGRLVEGSVIGSILCALLMLPGFSMIAAGIKRKEQRFNAKSAGVTSTMLIMMLVAAFAPTFFQELYGTFELKCGVCPPSSDHTSPLKCRECRYFQPHPTLEPIYATATRPLTYICASVLFLTYVIGLWFTLRTHSSRIYPKKKLSEVVQEIADVASSVGSGLDSDDESDDEMAGGHGSSNWGPFKSVMLLLTATVLFSMIAEVLVSCVSVVLENNKSIDEKFLGITLFAIVPSMTEIYNGIAFAQQGNLALSFEVGSAYAIQIALVQLPALIVFSTWWRNFETFTLIFPRWDVISVVLSVFMLTYIYIEGKSNYFKGTMLSLAYVVMIAAFWYVPTNDVAS